MNMTGSGADIFGHRSQEGDDVVFDVLFDFVDAGDLEVSPAPTPRAPPPSG